MRHVVFVGAITFGLLTIGTSLADARSIAVEAVRARPASETGDDPTADAIRQAVVIPAAAIDRGDMGRAKRLPWNAIQPVAEEFRTTGNPSLVPLKWAGYLEGKDEAGRPYGCTAQFVAPRAILTAAHCVRDHVKDVWYDINDMRFYLQYQNGTYSKEYKPVCASTLKSYRLPLNYDTLGDAEKERAEIETEQYDYAMILLDAESITGSFYWQAGWKEGDWYGATKIGYPAGVLSGQIIQSAHGAIIWANRIPPLGEFPQLLALMQFNPNLTSGTSGGAWVGNFSTTEAPDHNIVISISTFHPPDHPEMAFGPYFKQDDFKYLLDYTARGCSEK